MKLQQRLIRFYYGTYSTLAPKAAAQSSFKLFQKVRKKDIRPREQDFFERAKHFTVATAKEPVHCYELGNPNGDLVMLVHGWDSNAGSMSKIAFKLADMGKRVVLFNLPGHAFASSSHTNLLECRLAMSAVLESLRPEREFAVVSHSFGSAVTAYALSKNEFPVQKMVFLTNPNKVENIFIEFKNYIGLKEKAYKELLRLTREKLGEPIQAVSVENSLNQISFEQLLLIHDKNDRVLSYSNALEVQENVPNSELITFENIGHYKMLWNDQVVEKCTEFLDH